MWSENTGRACQSSALGVEFSPALWDTNKERALLARLGAIVQNGRAPRWLPRQGGRRREELEEAVFCPQERGAFLQQEQQHRRQPRLDRYCRCQVRGGGGIQEEEILL